MSSLVEGLCSQPSIFGAFSITLCPRSLDQFYVVSYYVKWVKTSWIKNTSKIFSVAEAFVESILLAFAFSKKTLFFVHSTRRENTS